MTRRPRIRNIRLPISLIGFGEFSSVMLIYTDNPPIKFPQKKAGPGIPVLSRQAPGLNPMRGSGRSGGAIKSRMA